VRRHESLILPGLHPFNHRPRRIVVRMAPYLRVPQPCSCRAGRRSPGLLICQPHTFLCYATVDRPLLVFQSCRSIASTLAPTLLLSSSRPQNRQPKEKTT
jgi:hypothetical protein